MREGGAAGTRAQPDEMDARDLRGEHAHAAVGLAGQLAPTPRAPNHKTRPHYQGLEVFQVPDFVVAQVDTLQSCAAC